MSDRIPFQTDPLDDFIANALRSKFTANAWLDYEFMKVYVRKGIHRIENSMYTCLDIASVEVDPQMQKRGLFQNFLTKAHEKNPWDVTYIENVLNPNLADHLSRHGWINTEQSFYKIKM